MNEAITTPKHLWIVGGLSLLWNAFGALDYTMTQTRNAAYLAVFTPEQRAYFDSFPTIMEAGWALGVWGALAGSVLLLMRNRHAVTAFAASILGLAVSTVWQFGMSDVVSIMGPAALYMTLFVWAVEIGLLIYARRQTAAGVLR